MSVEPELTVVVPTRNAAAFLEACLVSIRDQRTPDGAPLPLLLVVVDNHSTDGTRAIAEEHADLVLTAGPERSAQRNRGAAVTATPFVGFIDADMVLAPTVCAEALAELGDPAVDGVIVPEIAAGEGFWARCRGLEKRLVQGDPRVEAARIFRRARFDAAGGWDEALTAAEDWDLHDRVVALGGGVRRTSAVITHQEGRLRLGATFRKKRYYGRWLADYAARPWARPATFSPQRLASRPSLLARSPHLTAGLAVLKTVEALGIAAGMRDARRAGLVPSGAAHHLASDGATTSTARSISA